MRCQQCNTGNAKYVITTFKRDFQLIAALLLLCPKCTSILNKISLTPKN